MKTNRKRLTALAFFATLLLGACSTVESRIKDNPEAFARLTTDQQALVKAGQVGLGFRSEAVTLALGDPDRVLTRTDADGVTTIWRYVTYEADGRPLYSGYYHFGRRGRSLWGGYPYYLDYPHRTVRERFRVEFRQDRVTAITQDAGP